MFRGGYSRGRPAYGRHDDYDDYTCQHCGVEGTQQEVTSHGPHHTVKQGCWYPDDFRAMTCPRLDGLMYKCGKSHSSRCECGRPQCPVEFVVMWNFVLVIEPDELLTFASRGEHHSVKQSSHHHDYPCNMRPSGRSSSTHFIIRSENEKAERLSTKSTRLTMLFVDNFALGARRLFSMLPLVEDNKILTLGKNVLRLSQPAKPFVRFHDAHSLHEYRDALELEERRAYHARQAVSRLVSCVASVRLLRSLMLRQNLKGKATCAGLIFGFLGRQSFLPFNLSNAAFEYQEEDATAAVIEDISHGEVAATVDTEVAAQKVTQDWADHVVLLNQAAKITGDVEEGAPFNNSVQNEKINLLAFNRYPEAFCTALCEGHATSRCRAALEEAGCRWLLGSGAKVFVHPWQYSEALVAVVELGVDLRPYHVIVSESFEYYVEASLADLSCRQGARVRNRQALTEAASTPPDTCHTAADKDHSETESATDDGSDVPIVTKRTFLCAARILRNPKSVAQSTTEAHGGGLNPRRVDIASRSGTP